MGDMRTTLHKSNSQCLSLTIQLLPSLIVLTTLAYTLLARIKYINETFGASAGCDNCFSKNVVVFDLPFL